MVTFSELAIPPCAWCTKLAGGAVWSSTRQMKLLFTAISAPTQKKGNRRLTFKAKTPLA
nr:MAG TPA_asm: hypothetical protein [Caudoviricetes sp.]